MADINIPGGDASYASVVSLLHFDGADGSTTITDEKGKLWSTSASGSAQLSTAAPKFGSAALLLDGSFDYVSTTDAVTDFQFGTGDFTLEGWFKTSSTSIIDRVLFDFYFGNVADCWELYMNGSGDLEWYSSNGGGAALVLRGIGGAVNTGNWVHVAACRAGGTLRLFVDGVIKGTTTDARDYSPLQTAFAIGAQVNSRNAAYDWSGSIDEVRITKGVGRYSADFTPPAAPFPDGGALAQVLGGVSQVAAATVSAGVDRSFDAAQALDGVSQGATGAARASLAASQTTASVSQGAATAVHVVSAGAQTLAAVSQIATGTVAGSNPSFAAAQTLSAVGQTAAASTIAKATIAQTLASVSQAVTIAAVDKASAGQTLGGVLQSAAAASLRRASATQTLDAVSQSAAATVANTVHAFVAAQVLAAVSQVARMRHEYIFERNERTVDVRAESRVFTAAAEDRGFEVVPESRGIAIAGEDRRIAFTD